MASAVTAYACDLDPSSIHRTREDAQDADLRICADRLARGIDSWTDIIAGRCPDLEEGLTDAMRMVSERIQRLQWGSVDRPGQPQPQQEEQPPIVSDLGVSPLVPRY